MNTVKHVREASAAHSRVANTSPDHSQLSVLKVEDLAKFLNCFGRGITCPATSIKAPMSAAEIAPLIAQTFSSELRLAGAALPMRATVDRSIPSLLGIDPHGAKWLVRPELLRLYPFSMQTYLAYLAKSCAVCDKYSPLLSLQERILGAHAVMHASFLKKAHMAVPEIEALLQSFRELKGCGWSVEHERHALSHIQALILSKTGRSASVRTDYMPLDAVSTVFRAKVVPLAGLERWACRKKVAVEELFAMLLAPHDLNVTTRRNASRPEYPAVLKESIGPVVEVDKLALTAWMTCAVADLKKHASFLKLVVEQIDNKVNAADKDKKEVQFSISQSAFLQMFISNYGGADLLPEGKFNIKRVLAGPHRAKSSCLSSPFKSSLYIVEGRKAEVYPMDKPLTFFEAKAFKAELLFQAEKAEKRAAKLASIRDDLAGSALPSWIESFGALYPEFRIKEKKHNDIREFPWREEVSRFAKIAACDEELAFTILKFQPVLLTFLRRKYFHAERHLGDALTFIGARNLLSGWTKPQNLGDAVFPLIRLARLAEVSGKPPTQLLDALLNPSLKSIPDLAAVSSKESKVEVIHLLCGRENFATRAQSLIEQLKIHLSRLRVLSAALEMAAEQNEKPKRLSFELFERAGVSGAGEAGSPSAEVNKAWYQDPLQIKHLLNKPWEISDFAARLARLDNEDVTVNAIPLKLPRLANLVRGKLDQPAVLIFLPFSKRTAHRWLCALKDLQELAERKMETLLALQRALPSFIQSDISVSTLIQHVSDAAWETSFPKKYDRETTSAFSIGIFGHSRMRALAKRLELESELEKVCHAASLWTRLELFTALTNQPTFPILDARVRQLSRENFSLLTPEAAAATITDIVNPLVEACGYQSGSPDAALVELATPLLKKIFDFYPTAYGAVIEQMGTRALSRVPGLEEVVVRGLQSRLNDNPEGSLLMCCLDSGRSVTALPYEVTKQLSERAVALIAANGAALMQGAAGQSPHWPVLVAAYRFVLARGDAAQFQSVTKALVEGLNSMPGSLSPQMLQFALSAAQIFQERGLPDARAEILQNAWRLCMADEQADLTPWYSLLKAELAGEAAQQFTRTLLPDGEAVSLMLHRAGIPEEFQRLLINNAGQENLKTALDALPDRDPAGLAISSRTLGKGALADAALAVGSRAQRYMLARLAFYEARHEGEAQLVLRRAGNRSMTAPNHWMFLGVPRTATPAVIATSLQILRTIFHPDWFREQPDKKSEAELLIREATKAHDVLVTPAKRREYDTLVSYGLGIMRSGPPLFPVSPWFSRLVADGLFEMEEADVPPETAQSSGRRLLS